MSRWTFYHFEGGLNFEEGGNRRLSLDSLDNERLLFLSRDIDSWQSFIEDQRLYRVTIKPVKEYPIISEWDKYFNLSTFSTIHGIKKHTVGKNTELASYVDEGYRLFELDKFNDKNELPELFLVKPKESVLSIEDITTQFFILPLIAEINS